MHRAGTYTIRVGRSSWQQPLLSLSMRNGTVVDNNTWAKSSKIICSTRWGRPPPGHKRRRRDCCRLNWTFPSPRRRRHKYHKRTPTWWSREYFIHNRSCFFIQKSHNSDRYLIYESLFPSLHTPQSTTSNLIHSQWPTVCQNRYLIRGPNYI